MRNYYLAVDIGASSGRHILGYVEDGRMAIEEIYRFENGMQNRNGRLYWDVSYLFEQIVAGMKKCGVCGKIPVSMSIDTWAVDYVLLDENDQIIGETYGYRDDRTKGMDRLIYEKISERELYERTGIQKQIFNTIYQLMALRQQEPQYLQRAKTFLMLPDYFQFLLTGNKVSEYTNATSTQLVNAEEKQWDMELIRRIGYPESVFLPLRMPGTRVGNLQRHIREKAGFDCEVALCASHDTASAVMTMPVVGTDGVYLSSGTWSLMGVEMEKADCSEQSRQANFTNEGGYDHRFRYLKNIMGLWMIQSVRHELGESCSFAQLCELAEENQDFPSRVDVNDPCFLAPKNMTREIRAYCKKKGGPVPQSVGEIASVIYQSLADSYGETLRELEKNTGKAYDSIHVIGGGSNADYLNRLTAFATKKIVYAGPGEATAVGNLIAQMIKNGEFANLEEARGCVYKSFDIREIRPEK